jgi:hypothetical protein
VKEVVRNKRKCYRNLEKCRSTENFENYKVVRIETKEDVRKVRSTNLKDLYEKLDQKIGRRIYINLLVSWRRRLEILVW